MSLLETLAAEWYEHAGSIVRTNVLTGKRAETHRAVKRSGFVSPASGGRPRQVIHPVKADPHR
ncbi:hypothetical protein VT85_22085 [Planctomyces sp. SH-PL62]|nr:hypothetical protein VT85_22085 [Planctomyces sp. SH-PL62]